MKSMSLIAHFSGGFALGLICISLVQAALPKRTMPAEGSNTTGSPAVVSELKAPKVTAPSLEADFDRLQRAEGQFAEGWDQQERIRAATGGAPSERLNARRPSRPAPRPENVETTTIRTEAASAETAPTRRVKPQTQLPREKKRPNR